MGLVIEDDSADFVHRRGPEVLVHLEKGNGLVVAVDKIRPLAQISQRRADYLGPGVVQVHLVETVIDDVVADHDLIAEFFLERIRLHEVVLAAVDEIPSVVIVDVGCNQDTETVVREKDIIRNRAGSLGMIEYARFQLDGFERFTGSGVQDLQRFVRLVRDVQEVVVGIEVVFSRLPVQVERLQHLESPGVQFIDPVREFRGNPDAGFVLRKGPVSQESFDLGDAVMEIDPYLIVKNNAVAIGRFHLHATDRIRPAQFGPSRGN